MRQVFSSARLENAEGVATLLREAGIEVRITDGRSYKGNRRTTASYAERVATRPAVWVVRSEDQARAREILREAGLIESTRRGEGAQMMFRSEFGDESTRTPSQRRATRIKLALLAGIVIVVVMASVRTGRRPVVVDMAAPPFDGRARAMLAPIAVAVFARELENIQTPVACLAVDGADVPRDVRDLLRPQQGQTLVPASHCRRIADEETGSLHPRTKQPATIVELARFRASAPDTGTVEFTAYHHRMLARYKTLEVRRINGRWQVTRVIKHVST